MIPVKVSLFRWYISESIGSNRFFYQEHGIENVHQYLMFRFAIIIVKEYPVGGVKE